MPSPSSSVDGRQKLMLALIAVCLVAAGGFLWYQFSNSSTLPGVADGPAAAAAPTDQPATPPPDAQKTGGGGWLKGGGAQ